jgi:hypothetical protein
LHHQLLLQLPDMFRIHDFCRQLFDVPGRQPGQLQAGHEEFLLLFAEMLLNLRPIRILVQILAAHGSVNYRSFKNAPIHQHGHLQSPTHIRLVQKPSQALHDRQ